eukprot:jgi/Picre1/32192/NNA_007538.t1
MAEADGSHHINRENSAVSMDPGVVGTSSFGMSGINAHAMFSHIHKLRVDQKRGLNIHHAWEFFNRIEAKHLPLVLVKFSSITHTEGILYEMRELKSVEMRSFLAQSNGGILFVIESAVAVALSLYSSERGDKGSDQHDIVLHNTNALNIGLSLKGSFKARFVPQDGICSLVNEQATLAEATVAPGLVQRNSERKQHINRSNTLVSLWIEADTSCAQIATSSSQSDLLVDVYSLLGVCTLSGNGDNCAARVASLHLPQDRTSKFCGASTTSIIIDEDRGRLTRIEGLVRRMTGMHHPENLYRYQAYVNSASHAANEIPRNSKTFKPNLQMPALNIEQLLAEALSAIASAKTKSSLIISNIVNESNFNTVTPLLSKRLGKEYGIVSGYLNNVYLEMPTVSIQKFSSNVLIQSSEKSKEKCFPIRHCPRDMPIPMVFLHTSGSQQAATMPHTAPNISRRVHSGKFEPIEKLFRGTRPTLCANFFSSISAFLGNKNHASYSAANSAMDNIAIRLRVEGLSCTSTQWGAWGSIGMAAKFAASDEEAKSLVYMVATQSYWKNIKMLIGSNLSNQLEDIYEELQTITPVLEYEPNLEENGSKAKSNALRGKSVDQGSIDRILQSVLQIDRPDPSTPLGEQGLESLSSLDLKAKIDDLMGTSTVESYELITHTPASLMDLLLHDGGGAHNTLAEAEKNAVNAPVAASRAKMRLFCLPWAGGVAENLFAHWNQIFPSCIDVYPVQIPGRGRRSNEEPIDSLPALSEHLIETLPLDEMPYAIFGTCLGAIIGYDMIQRLQKCGRKMPLLFIPAAVSPPDKYASVIMQIYNPKRNHLFGNFRVIKDEVIAHLRDWRSLPKENVLHAFEAGHFAGIEEMKQSKDLYDLVAPMAVNDIMMAVQYEYSVENTPLSCPILAFDGAKDNTIPKGYMKGWTRHTQSSFERIVIDSNHYFVASEYLQVASKAAAACLEALEHENPILSSRHSWIGAEAETVTQEKRTVSETQYHRDRSRIRLAWIVICEVIVFMLVWLFWLNILKVSHPAH